MLLYTVPYLVFQLSYFTVHGGKHREYVLDQNDDDIIESPGFPSLYNSDGDTYVYRISSSLSSDKYVRLVAEDFLLSPSSILRVYDGDMNGAMVAWRRGARPIYQSTRSSVVMVFKTGTSSYSQPDALGFRIKYSFSSDTRSYWANTTMPSTGYCGSYNSYGSYGAASTKGVLRDPRGDNTFINVYRVDCVWAVHLGVSGYLLMSVPQRVWLKDGSISIHRGLTSAGPAFELTGNYSQSMDIVVSVRAPSFRVHLSRRLPADEMVTFVTDATSGSARDALYQRVTNDEGKSTASRCPYKQCSSGACVLYWESCQGLLGPSSSCEGDTGASHMQCQQLEPGGRRKCYDAVLDRCDGYDDCGDNSDELDCLDSETGEPHDNSTQGEEKKRFTMKDITSSLGSVVFIIVLIVICHEVRKRNSTRRWLPSCGAGCLRDLCSCCHETLTSLGRRIRHAACCSICSICRREQQEPGAHSLRHTQAAQRSTSQLGGEDDLSLDSVEVGSEAAGRALPYTLSVPPPSYVTVTARDPPSITVRASSTEDLSSLSTESFISSVESADGLPPRSASPSLRPYLQQQADPAMPPSYEEAQEMSASGGGDSGRSSGERGQTAHSRQSSLPSYGDVVSSTNSIHDAHNADPPPPSYDSLDR